MRFLEYLYYRMYKAYAKKNDNPFWSTFFYLAGVQFTFIIIILIYLDKMLQVGNVVSDADLYNFKRSRVLWIGLTIPIFLFTYFRFSKKDFVYYENQYSNYHSLNKSVKIWMLVFFPIFLLFFSIFVLVLLFGGEIVGKKITGLFGAKFI